MNDAWNQVGELLFGEGGMMDWVTSVDGGGFMQVCRFCIILSSVLIWMPVRNVHAGLRKFNSGIAMKRTVTCMHTLINFTKFGLMQIHKVGGHLSVQSSQFNCLFGDTYRVV
jgi:hypothetical protein